MQKAFTPAASTGTDCFMILQRHNLSCYGTTEAPKTPLFFPTCAPLPPWRMVILSMLNNMIRLQARLTSVSSVSFLFGVGATEAPREGTQEEDAALDVSGTSALSTFPDL